MLDVLKELRQIDGQHKDDSYHHDWEVQWSLYSDRGREYVRDRLRELKLGIARDRQPFECSLLRHVIDLLAVVYASPPIRRLVDENGATLPEDTSEHEAFVAAYERSAMNATLRQVDRERTLFRQVALRLYPSDLNRRIRVAIFHPGSVLRAPSMSDPEDLRADSMFALALADGTYELWERTADGHRMTLVDRKGDALPAESQPFAESGLFSPYEELPVLMTYDGAPSGPWLAPKSSRTSYPLNIASLLAEVLSGIKWNNNPEVIYEQTTGETAAPVKPGDMPRQHGPGIRNLLPPGVSSQLLSIAPNVEPALAAINAAIELWMRSESLPTDALQRSQSVTGLALKTLAAPLQERQESLRSFALDTERRLFDAYWAVHRVHAPSWEVETLPAGYSVDVELGAVDTPQDPGELSQIVSRDMALRLASPIDALQARFNLSRDQAIKRYGRVQADWERYPIRTDLDLTADEATQTTDPTPEEPNPAGSVIQTIRDA